MELQRIAGVVQRQQCGSGSYIFSIPQGLGSDYEIARSRHNEEGPIVHGFLTNDRCIFDTTHPNSYQYRATVAGAEKGCVVLILLNIYGKPTEIPGGQGRPVSYGYAAFVFDGVSWGEWRKPHDVKVEKGVGGGFLLSVCAGKRIIVQSDSYKDDWFLLNTSYILDYSVGLRSLADLLALDGEWRRRGKNNEKEKKLEEALQIAKKLKGAVHSKTAAQIVNLIEEAIYPF